jgi:hypothetical protein
MIKVSHFVKEQIESDIPKAKELNALISEEINYIPENVNKKLTLLIHE